MSFFIISLLISGLDYMIINYVINKITVEYHFIVQCFCWQCTVGVANLSSAGQMRLFALFHAARHLVRK